MGKTGLAPRRLLRLRLQRWKLIAQLFLFTAQDYNNLKKHRMDCLLISDFQI